MDNEMKFQEFYLGTAVGNRALCELLHGLQNWYSLSSVKMKMELGDS